MNLTYPCAKIGCTNVANTPEDYIKHQRQHEVFDEKAEEIFQSPREAIRDPQNLRYDILDSEFLDFMAKIADYGAKKYGEFNWHKSRLTGDKSPINHIMKHISKYRQHQFYDHVEIGLDPKIHLAAIAFNAMMEFFYESDEFKNRSNEVPAKGNPGLDEPF